MIIKNILSGKNSLNKAAILLGSRPSTDAQIEQKRAIEINLLKKRGKCVCLKIPKEINKY